MSKIGKLLKHPILFFKDIGKRPSVSYFKNEISVANISLYTYEVALYFSGTIGNIYQIQQWIEILKVLNEQKEVIFIVRNKRVYNWLSEKSSFVVVYCKTVDDLNKIYTQNNFKCILYVNNGYKNFQSLMLGNALHVHINHGESDKTSTISNQSKAYDYVLIVSEAAYIKYNLNLIKKDMRNYIQVGRPQLEHIEEIAPFVIENDTSIMRKKVILYAPTWEGTHESMNFTSLNDYGMSLVKNIIDNPEFYLIYKPHPHTGSRDTESERINKKIIEILNTHKNGEVVLEGDINSLYKHINLAIFDNSAVAVDYLQVDKPMIMTDMFYRLQGDQEKPQISKAAVMLAVHDVQNIATIISKELKKDSLKEIRNTIKYYFLGHFDYSKNESTKKFISTILDIINERDELVLALDKMNEIHSSINNIQKG